MAVLKTRRSDDNINAFLEADSGPLRRKEAIALCSLAKFGD